MAANGQELIVFDRSRIEAWEDCPRKRWWLYEWGGRGVERVTLNLDLSIGIYTHRMLDGVMRQLQQGDDNPGQWLPQLIGQQLQDFERELRQRGLALEAASGYEQDEEGNINTQPGSLDFIIGLYSCWMQSIVTLWTARRAPLLLNEYQIVDVEREERMELAVEGQPELFMSRLDAILRRHGDGQLFVLNFKTVGDPNQWWQEQWRHDQQTLSEVLPVEARLGERLSGVLIEGLVKGSKRAEWPWKSGNWYNNSPLCWAWKKEGAAPFPSEYAARYEWQDATGTHRLGKGYRRVPVFQDGEMGADRWLQWLVQHELELVDQQFVSLPPILRNDWECQRWLNQNLRREADIRDSRAAIGELCEERQHAPLAMLALDQYFPMHTGNGNCLRPSKCPAYDLCWAAAGADPLRNGYQWRNYNHPLEDPEAPERQAAQTS